MRDKDYRETGKGFNLLLKLGGDDKGTWGCHLKYGLKLHKIWHCLAHLTLIKKHNI